MKTILTIILFLSVSVFGQNVAVLTYEFAAPEAVANGCPPGWPFAIKDIGAASELPDGLKSPWVVMTKDALRVQMESLSAAKEIYNNREEPSAAPRRQLIADIVADLRAIRQSSGNLSAAQMSNALRRIATALLILIEEEKVSLK